MVPGLDGAGLIAFRVRALCYALVPITAAAVLGLQAGVAQAGPTFRESAAASTLPYPDSLDWNFEATACGLTECASVGYYEDPNGNDESLVVPSAAGTPGAGVEVKLPSNSSPAAADSSLDGVSCWSLGACVAVGYYRDASRNNQALVVPITNGSVGTGIEVGLPAAAAIGAQDANLTAVDCTAAGMCVAVGYFKDAARNYLPLAVPIANGSPGTSATGLLPTGALSGRQDASLEDVSCAASGPCEAVGYFKPNANNYLPFTESVTGGAPANVAPVSVPGNAHNGSGGDHATLEHVSCWAAGACAAVGSYQDTSGNYQELAVSIANSLPQPGVEAAMPAGANPAVGGGPTLGGIACQSAADCLAVGFYYDSSQTDYAVAVPLTNGVVGGDASISFPSNTAVNGPYSSLFGVGCPPSGACLATGYYYDTSNEADGLTLTFDGGSVGAGVAAAAPVGAANTGSDAYLDRVACGASGSCLAAGVQVSQGVGIVPYVLSAQAPLLIGTTALPGGTVGMPYRASLSATGAWDSYTWSLVSGSLLPGLSLDPQTGVVSGTPRASGRVRFSVAATGTGTPAQTTTQSVSLTVAAGALRLVTRSAVVRSNRVRLRLRCSAGVCSGTAKLEWTKKVTVRHGKRRVHKRLTVVIGSSHFSIAGGHTGAVRMVLNGKGRRALASHSPLRATLVAVVHGVREMLGHVTLRAAAVKRSKKH
jgi:hypothetical protein